jgi:hypothetical protein
MQIRDGSCRLNPAFFKFSQSHFRDKYSYAMYNNALLRIETQIIILHLSLNLRKYITRKGCLIPS